MSTIRTAGIWRQRSRAVIEDAVGDLPPDASIQEVKRVLRAAYPFGQREAHPYKAWCQEQSDYLRRRFPQTFAEHDREQLKKELAGAGLSCLFSPEDL